MKKILAIAAVMVMAAGSAFAQKGSWYIGTTGINPGLSGSMNMGSSFVTGFNYSEVGGVKTTTIGLAPEAGVFVSDKWVVGLGLAYNYVSVKDGGSDSYFGVNPYARYYAYKFGKFGFYLQGGFELWNGNDATTWSVNIKPGVQYGISERFAINATFGKLGYFDYDGDSEFALDLDGSSLNFGLTYKF